MTATVAFENETGNATSLPHVHNTTHEQCYIGFSGDSVFGTATVTPWVALTKDVKPAALVGISYTAIDGGNMISLPMGATLDLRTTGAGGGTDITAVVVSQEGS